MLCHKENITKEPSQTSTEQIIKWLKFATEKHRLNTELDYGEQKSEKALKIWRSNLQFSFMAATRKGRHCGFQIWRELSLLA